MRGSPGLTAPWARPAPRLVEFGCALGITFAGEESRTIGEVCEWGTGGRDDGPCVVAHLVTEVGYCAHCDDFAVFEHAHVSILE